MNKREVVVNALEAMGYKPEIDSDGDVKFSYQMKTLYVLGTQKENDGDNYIVVMLPQFCEISEGDEIKALTVCNKLTRDVTVAKLYIDRTLKDVTSSYEFFYCGEECLRAQLEHSLDIIGMMRSAFYKALREFS